MATPPPSPTPVVKTEAPQEHQDHNQQQGPTLLDLYRHPPPEPRTIGGSLLLSATAAAAPAGRSMGVGVVVLHSCNCRRSNCLKLYCECFAHGVYCAQVRGVKFDGVDVCMYIMACPCFINIQTKPIIPIAPTASYTTDPGLPLRGLPQQRPERGDAAAGGRDDPGPEPPWLPPQDCLDGGWPGGGWGQGGGGRRGRGHFEGGGRGRGGGDAAPEGVPLQALALPEALLRVLPGRDPLHGCGLVLFVVRALLGYGGCEACMGFTVEVDSLR